MKVRTEDMNERMCILTRARGQADDLIRFVASPDGEVVPDLKHVLPGRGCWLTADRDMVAEAVRKKLFARALKAEITVPEDLPQRIDALLASSLLGMVNMAKKSGQFVNGSGKVDAAIRSGDAIALFHSTDAAPDGVRKLRQAATARMHAMDEPELPVFRLFSGDELASALGEGAFIHAAALAGQAGEGVVKRAKVLARYRSASVDRAKEASQPRSG